MKTFIIQHENRYYPEIPQTIRLLASCEYNALVAFKSIYNARNDRLVIRMKEIKE